MHFVIVNKDYFNYLKQFDSRIGFIDYDNRLKIHIGVVLNVNSIDYYVPLSSPKPKHNNMPSRLDFHKITNEKGQLFAVLNLNNMIPVPKNCLTVLKYSEIDTHRKFKNLQDKNNYVYLLQIEESIINQQKDVIQDKAKNLYLKCSKFPMSSLAKRCCNFQLLENKSLLYQK